jgi:uncharacterized membrane protein
MNTSPMTARPHPSWRWPLAYVLTAVVFLAMDGVWLSATQATFYKPTIGHLMAPTIDWLAVALFYPLYLIGLVFFAVAPAVDASRAVAGFLRGGLFGLIAYATYDFTNQATLRDWPWQVTVIDLLWGAVVSGTASGVAAALTLVTCRRASRTSGR